MMAETKMQLVDWLDDLCVRFVINLPHEELTSVERICFQIEEAQWFYEDFIRAQDPSLPQMNLRRFCELIFQHCPLLAPFQASAQLSYAEFLAYKTRVPVRGAIMLNADMTEVVLVKGWKKSAKWSFPRGKINKEERDLDCAVREVYEETGYDIKCAGLVAEKEEDVKYIDMALREQQMRLYVFRDVPMDTHFEPRTRKEISKISWFKVTELAATNPKHAPIQSYGPVSTEALKASQFYMVAPFIRPLRQWIKQQKNLDRQGKRRSQNTVFEESEAEGLSIPKPMAYDDGMMTTDPEDDGHFKRLLSNLQPQQPIHEQALQPEPAAANTADLSAQLKAMLSVGGPVAPPAQQQPQSNPLMSALFGEPHSQHGQRPPHTPMEQILHTPPPAHTPHHHHPRPPPYSEMAPPPQFPLSPQHMQHGPPHPQFQQMPPHWQNQNMPQAFHGQIPQHMPSPQHIQHPQDTPFQNMEQRGLFGTDIPAPPPMQISNPLRTGDPAFRSSAHFPQYNQTTPQQPMPKAAPQKLTNHAMNLLNVFNSPDAVMAQPVQQAAQASPRHLPELADDQTKPILPSQLLGGGPPPPPHNRRPSPQQIHQPQAQRSRSSHQDSLLNLFASAKTPVAPQQQGHQAPLSALEPVELAAQPSPLISREIVKPVSHKLSMRRLPLVNTRDIPVSQSPNLTSATVSGPLNTPNFETAQKSRPVELGNGIVSPSPGTIGFAPQIMPRPASGAMKPGSSSLRQSTATPPVPVHTVGLGVAMEAPRPYQPTSILRRSGKDIEAMATADRAPKIQNPPQQVPQIQPTQHDVRHAQVPLQPGRAPIAAYDRRDSSSMQHKSALLGLFSAGGLGSGANQDTQRNPAEYSGSLPIHAHPTGQGHGRANGIGSPVSPLPSHLRHHDQSRQETRSSRISSINSVPGDLNPLTPTTGISVLGNMPLTSAPANIASFNNNGNTTSASASVSVGNEHAQTMLNMFKNTGAGVAPSARNTASPPIKRGAIGGIGSGKDTGGATSPITPVEKSFLLGLLQNTVAKEGEKMRNSAGASAGRQGSLR